MKNISLAAFIIFMSAQCLFAQTSNLDFQSEITPIQQELLGKLTGHIVIKNSGRLTDRQSIERRKITQDFLFESLKSMGLSPKRHEYKTRKEGVNIYAVIPSTTDSKDYVVLGAHYDSVEGSPGANDNASGVALVFSVAYKLSKLKKRSINFIIVFFDQEEFGLIGSRAFAQKLKKERINLHSAHTVDQVGWDKDADGAIELELPAPDLEKIYLSEARKLSIPVHKTHVASTDHTAFREIGFKAVGITEEYMNKDTTPHYHKDTDAYETINFDYLASSTKLVLNVMKHFAQADDISKR